MTTEKKQIDFIHRQSAHCESGVASNLLYHYGIDCSEALAFGIGEGLFFGYMPFISIDRLPLTTYRCRTGEIFKRVTQRLGVTVIKKKINAYKLKTKDSIKHACQAILKKHKTQDFFYFVVHNDPVVTYKNARPGRPAKNAEKIAVYQDHFSIELNYDETACTKAQYQIGYYPLITNKPACDFSIEDAMLAYKNQYKVEHLYKRSKSGHKLEPIYLQTPDRIEAYLFLFKIALQILVLMERTTKKKIAERDKGLDNFMPNKRDVRNPKTENMLAMFEFVVCGLILLHDGSQQYFVSKLT